MNRVYQLEGVEHSRDTRRARRKAPRDGALDMLRLDIFSRLVLYFLVLMYKCLELQGPCLQIYTYH